MIKIHAKLQRLLNFIHEIRYMYLVQIFFCMMWKKKNKCFICVTTARNWLNCIWAHQYSCWYSFQNKKKIASLWRWPHLHKDHLKIVGKIVMVRMLITFVTLKMAFVLACTIGDANNMSCQSIYKVHFVTIPWLDFFLHLWLYVVSHCIFTTLTLVILFVGMLKFSKKIQRNKMCEGKI
jgi:hypothetical protein